MVDAMTTRPLRFTSAGAELAGELVTPDGPGPHPAVILLHGAGWGLRSFYAAYVEAFVEAGIASFVFDRRGEGESGGSPEQDIFAFADDAVAACEAVRGLPEVDPARVGLWGYSNGAWVAARAASRLPDCAFLVLTGAAGVSPAASEVFRRVEDLRSQGIDGPVLEAVRRAWQIIFDYVSRGEWAHHWDAELAALRAIIEADPKLQALPIPEMVRARPELDSVPRFDSPMLANLREAAKGANPDMGFDPIPALQQVTCPILAVLAEFDANVPMAESVARFAEVAASRKGAEFRIEVLPGAGHEFARGTLSNASNPDWATRPRRREEFREGYLELMAGWIAGHAH